jgi:hypothetical protein
MKQDISLIRAILIKVQEAPPVSKVSDIKVEGYNQDTIGEHVRLLHQGGFIEAHLAHSSNVQGVKYVASYRIRRLTFEGQGFAANLANKNVWSKLKEKLAGQEGQIELAALKALASKAILDILNLS